MGGSRRPTDQGHQQIVRERAKGAAVRGLGIAPKVSTKTVCNVLCHGRFAVSASDGRTRELTVKVTERDLRGFEAAFSHCGIAHRPDALRRSILSATTFYVQMRT